MTAAAKLLLGLVILYLSWIGMMVVHELGHVVHAIASGGQVDRVVLPMLDFSRTDVSPNPHPHFVAWGGPCWGVMLPLIAWLLMSRLRLAGRKLVMFFAGFCLVANGAYIGLGWAMTSGDAADLLRYGTPRWVMTVFGLLSLSCGIWLWHRLDLMTRNAGKTPLIAGGHIA